MGSIYELDGRVPLTRAVPFGLQHVLAMFVANITPIIILAGVVGLDKGVSAALIQNCMIIQYGVSARACLSSWASRSRSCPSP